MSMLRTLWQALCPSSPLLHSPLQSLPSLCQAHTHQALEQPRWPGDDDHQLLHQLRDEGDLGALGSLVGLWGAQQHLRVPALNSEFLCLTC